MTTGYAPPAPVCTADERERRKHRLTALAALAGQVSPTQLDSAILALSPGTRDVYAVREAEQGAFSSGLTPHQLLLRDAAIRAGYRADAVPLAASGEGMARDGSAPTLRLTFPSAVALYAGQLLTWATPAGRPGVPVNGATTDTLWSKFDTKMMLARLGVPVPCGQRFPSTELEAALRYAAECQDALCVKPDRSANGRLVAPGLVTAEAITGACATVARHSDALVVEEHVAGEAWRFFWVAPEIVGIKVGRPASVVGDGIQPLRALIDQWQQERRSRVASGMLAPWHPGQELASLLAQQGQTLESVPSEGTRVFLKWCSNGTQGADSLTVPSRLHPAYLRAITEAFQCLPEVQVAAADVMISDPTVPPPVGRYAVVEINTAPSLLAYHQPAEGPVQDVSGAIIRCLARRSAEGGL